MNPKWAYTVVLFVTAFFVVFFLYPAVEVLRAAFYDQDEGLTFAFVTEVFKNPVYTEGLWNAFLLGIMFISSSLKL